MSVEAVKAYFARAGMESRVLELPESSATVALAAQALKTEPCRIAKTLSFMADGKAVLVVTAGDTKIDNAKYRHTFGCKARMLTAAELSALVGHEAGGVCPFALPESVSVYLDESLRRFKTVFPAAGNANSAIELTCAELEAHAEHFAGWVDVSKLIAENGS